MMTRRFWCALVGFVLPVAGLPAQEGGQFWEKHAFFKHLTGAWKSSGELVSKEKTQAVTEEWEGKASSDTEFQIKGTRTFDGEMQKFRWSFTRNAATDTLEAIMVTNDDEAGRLRFEISYSEVENVMELTAPMGNGASKLLLKARFEDDKPAHEKLVFDLIITGDDGEENLKGKVSHEKVKAP
jgi:hypothetical protein